MKKAVLITMFCCYTWNQLAQQIFSERFSGLSLQNYTVATGSGSYTFTPPNFQVINDGRHNKIGTSLNPNLPYNEPSLKTAGWMVSTHPTSSDTFAVSTSWLDTTSNSVNRWLITPTIAIPASGYSVLKWRARAPDKAFRDGYEVYVKETNSLNLTTGDFLLGDRFFVKPDNNITGGGENSQWTNRSVSLYELFAGKTVRIAFRNNSKDRFQLWIDDIVVETVPNKEDIAVLSAETSRYIYNNQPDSVWCSFTSLGANTVYSLTLNYQVGNSTIYSQNYTSTDGWGHGSMNNTVFALPYQLNSTGRYKVKVWVSSVNGLADPNNSNDTAITYVHSFSSNDAPIKRAMLEQIVSAHNGEGADAQEKMLAVQSESVVCVNVHVNDSMYVPAMAGFINEFKGPINTALADRVYFRDINKFSFERPFYPSKANDRKNAAAPLALSVVNKVYNSSTKEVLFTIKADINTELFGEYTMGAYLVENHVHGPDADTLVNGYNQFNDFYHVPWSPYYQKGYFSDAANSHILNSWQFKHQNVLVHTFDGAFGDATVIPQTGGTTFQSYSKTFLTTLPSAPAGVQKYVADNIYIVGFVAEGGPESKNRRILNTIKEKLTANSEVISVKENNALHNISVFPNPSMGNFYVSFPEALSYQTSIRIMDFSGREINFTTDFKTKETTIINISGASAGIYLMEIFTKEGKITKKIVVTN